MSYLNKKLLKILNKFGGVLCEFFKMQEIIIFYILVKFKIIFTNIVKPKYSNLSKETPKLITFKLI